jgi:hypothetical protein
MDTERQNDATFVTRQMKIDLIERGAPECPFIRIFGRDEAGIVALRVGIRNLRTGVVDQVAIHELQSYQTADPIALYAVVAEADVGVTRTELSWEYRWDLTDESWRIVAGLIEGMLPLKPGDFYQWLAGGEARYG